MVKSTQLLIFLLVIFFNQNIFTKFNLEEIFSFHNNKINTINISPNNKFVATGSCDGDTVVYDIKEKRKHVFGDKIFGIVNFVTSIAFSIDNKLIAIGSSDHSPNIWDLTDGKKKLTLRGHNDFISSIAFSKNNNFILTSSYDYFAIIWDLKGNIKFRLKHPASVSFASISNDSSFIVSASKNLAFVWDTLSGSRKSILIGRHSDNLSSLAISPNNKFIVTAYQDGTAVIWDSNGSAIRTFTDHSNAISCMAITNDYLITGSFDCNIYVRDINTGQLINKLQGDGLGWIFDLKILKNFLVVGSSDKCLRIFNIKTGKLIKKFSDFENIVSDLTVGSSEDFFIAASKNKAYLYREKI